VKVSKFKLWDSDADIDDILNRGYDYQLTRWVVTASDIVVGGTIVNILYLDRVTFGVYFQVMMITFALLYFITALIVNRPKYLAYKFIVPLRSKEVKCDIICANADDLYAIMYKEMHIKLVKDASLDYYIALINKACGTNQYYPYNIYAGLMKIDRTYRDGCKPIYVYSAKRSKHRKSGLIYISLEDEMLNAGKDYMALAEASSEMAENHIIYPEAEKDTAISETSEVEEVDNGTVLSETKESEIENDSTSEVNC